MPVFLPLEGDEAAVAGAMEEGQDLGPRELALAGKGRRPLAALVAAPFGPAQVLQVDVPDPRAQDARAFPRRLSPLERIGRVPDRTGTGGADAFQDRQRVGG